MASAIRGRRGLRTCARKASSRSWHPSSSGVDSRASGQDRACRSRGPRSAQPATPSSWPPGAPTDGQIRTAMAQSAGCPVMRAMIRSGSTAASLRSAPSPSGISGSTRRISSVASVTQRTRRGPGTTSHRSVRPRPGGERVRVLPSTSRKNAVRSSGGKASLEPRQQVGTRKAARTWQPRARSRRQTARLSAAGIARSGPAARTPATCATKALLGSTGLAMGHRRLGPSSVPTRIPGTSTNGMPKVSVDTE